MMQQQRFFLVILVYQNFNLNNRSTKYIRNSMFTELYYAYEYVKVSMLGA